MALIVGGIGEGHLAVVVDSWFCCQQGNVVDAGDCLVDISPALAAESEGSGLGGFEGVARPVSMYHFRNRLDLGKNRRCGIDPDCTKGQGFTGVSRGIAQSQFTVAVLTVSGKADREFGLALIHMLQITTTFAGVYEAACFTGFYLHLYIPALNLKIPDL
ncbi:MAG: hypothetical protein ACKVIP_02095, partial [bacterium]